MGHKANDRPSDEVPFLTEEEKDDYAAPRRHSRRARCAYLLPYSGLLNIALLLALLATWTLQGYSPKKAYIPNEIYCKQLYSFGICIHLTADSASAGCC